MGFNPGGGGGIAGASDVALSNPVNNHFLTYDGPSSKWDNSSIVGIAALSNGGGSETVQTLSASGSQSLNLTNGNVFNLTLTGSATFSFAGATAGRACSFTLYKKQNSTGGYSVTWPSSVKWSAGAPSLTTSANSIDILVFESIDGGTTWFGSLVGTNFS